MTMKGPHQWNQSAKPFARGTLSGGTPPFQFRSDEGPVVTIHGSDVSSLVGYHVSPQRQYVTGVVA